MKRTVTAALAQAARAFPDRTYAARKTDAGWLSFSYSEIHAMSRRFASWLLKSGLRKGDRVAVLAEGSPEWIVAEMGTLLAAGVSVPLSIQLMPEEIVFRMNHSGATVLAVGGAALEKALQAAPGIERPFTLVFLGEDGPALREALAPFPPERALALAECLDRGARDFPFDELARLEEEISEDDLVSISYTSGTTGNPKGVMLTHLNYYSNSQDAVRVFQIPPLEYQTLLVLPCDHAFAHTTGIFCSLLRGISLYFADMRGGRLGMIRSLPQSLQETSPVFLLTVPSLAASFRRKILRDIDRRGGIVRTLFYMGLRAGIRYHGDGWNRPRLRTRIRACVPYRLADRLVFSKIRALYGNRLKFFVGGGALMDVKLQEFFNALGMPVYQGYGLTEASPVVSTNSPRAHKFGSCGKILPGSSCEILNSGGYPAGIGEVGEICVRGPNVMKGYYRNEEATREVLKDGLLRTGDRGYVDEDRFLVVVGREKALLISPDGEKYSPEEIEEAMTIGSPMVHQILLYNDHRKYTSALVVLDQEAVRAAAAEKYLTDPEDILQEIRDSIFSFRRDPYYARRFPPQWLPATFRILEEAFSEENGMMNSTQKILRHRALEIHRDKIEGMYAEGGDSPLGEANLEAVRRIFRKTPDAAV